MRFLSLPVISLILCLAFCPAAQASSPRIIEVTSPKGVKAWLVEDHKLPLISMRFAFRGGVEQDPADKQGLSVLSASLLTQGAGALDDRAFQEKLAANSISLDVSASRDWIVGQMKTLSRTKVEAFRLLGLALTQPRFDAVAFERLRDQQITSIKMQLSKPSWQGRYALYGHVFAGHPYNQRALGTQKSVNGLSAQDVEAFIKPRLAKDNLMISVVGAIDAETLQEELDRMFGELPDHAILAEIPPVVWPEQEQKILLARDGKQTEILFAAPMLRRNDPDWYAAEVANYILGGGGFISRLMKAVRAEKGLTYGISTSLSSMDYASVLTGGFSTENAKANKALSLVHNVWSDFYSRGVTQEEVLAAQDYLVGSMAISLTSTDAIAQMLLAMQTEGLGRDYLEHRERLIRGVTKEDVERVIKVWFNPEKLSYSYVGQPDGLAVDQKRSLVME